MKFQTTYISVHLSEQANIACRDHFNEVISLQTHIFPIQKLWEMESKYKSPTNTGKNTLVTARDIKLQSTFESKGYEQHI
jgi:hypothetical protein